jgi:outer membrane lipoprotein-sorting protein
MTSAEATKVGKRWEFWKKGTVQYKDLESVISVKSLASLLPKSKGTTLSTQGSDYVLTWTSAASGSTPKLKNTLTIAKGTNLPVEETSTDASGEKVTTTISKWGEAVAVHAPPAGSAVAASKITG